MDKNNFFSDKAIWIVLCLGVFIGVGASAGLAVKIHSASDIEYCSSCHTLSPMVEAYKQDIHGGNNSKGLRAQCSDCHIPQDGPLRHVLVKSKTGMLDLYAEYFTDTTKIDWQSMRKNREHFVYDSGCLSCHKYVETATKSNRKAFYAHKNYFQPDSELKCVSCHENVGHLNLGEFITKAEVKR